jgi:hypothetical protein
MPQVRKIQKSRSRTAQIADRAKASKHLIFPKERKRIKRWANNPAKWDIKGVDTPGSKITNKSTPDITERAALRDKMRMERISKRLPRISGEMPRLK